MTRFALTVEYDGRPFVGWQRQSEGASVQGSIERALFEVTGENAAVHAAGRTDAGVHATAMRAHVDVAKPLSPFRLMDFHLAARCVVNFPAESASGRLRRTPTRSPRLRKGGG